MLQTPRLNSTVLHSALHTNVYYRGSNSSLLSSSSRVFQQDVRRPHFRVISTYGLKNHQKGFKKAKIYCKCPNDAKCYYNPLLQTEWIEWSTRYIANLIQYRQTPFYLLNSPAGFYRVFVEGQSH